MPTGRQHDDCKPSAAELRTMGYWPRDRLLRMNAAFVAAVTTHGHQYAEEPPPKLVKAIRPLPKADRPSRTRCLDSRP